ncbi:MAG: ATP-binding protein [Planctomycetaceae bacterium]|nr:ATP-binding protein [Planctomycetaceae bacterium]
MVNILVVDDSTIDRKIVGGLLKKVPDWVIDFAQNGLEAMELLRRTDRDHPDLILTDLQMPEMNGLELVNEVQQECPLIPVVLMTAQGSEAIAVEALQTGASSYVPKKQLVEMLIKTIQQVLSASGERKTKKTLAEKMESISCQFKLNNDPVILTSLVSYIQGILSDMQILSETDRLRTGVALEEALLNAAYHGNLEVSSELREVDHARFYDLAKERTQIAPYMDRRILVDVSIDQAGIRYQVRDEGPGFDPSTLPDPTDPANLERPCGRGLLLMRTFMDEVNYNDCGNEVTMRKRAVKTTSSS